MKINNFSQATKDLQAYLPDYLSKQGIDTSRNFKCLNPNHQDNKPSMSLVKPDNIRAFCFSCSRSYDLFDAVNVLENKPLNGSGFVTETLPYLSEMFGVQLEHLELTEEEQYEIDTYRVYRQACDYITSWKAEDIPEDVKIEIARRGWDLSTATDLLRSSGTGFITDFSVFRTYLKSLGYSATFLDDIDLGRKDLFGPGHLIFTVKDESGRPVGFAARNLIDNDRPKYVNQKTTGVKCNIYQKGKRLFGLDQALRHRREGPVFVMEGYTDVLSCSLNNFHRAVATCGTALTDDHILLLREHNIFDIVLCFDNDEAGQSKTEVLLDTKFSNNKDINVNILVIPTGKDPDDFIREQGIQAFLELKPTSAFQWRLNRFDESVDPEVICKKMLPLIAGEPSHISQERMLIDLSRFTGYNAKTLQAELQRLIDNKEKVKDRERQYILDKLTRDIQQRPTEIETILVDTQVKLHSLKSKYDQDKLSTDSFLKFIQDSKTQEETINIDKLGLKLGSDLSELEEAFRGEWRGALFFWGGAANSGKSTCLLNIGFQIASIPENNATVIFHTIDDSAVQLLPRLICIAEGSNKLEINHVKSPSYYLNKLHDLEYRRDEGYRRFMDLVRDGRFIMKDASEGNTLTYGESLIRYYQDKYPDRQIVYILDNFHKLFTSEPGGDIRTQFKEKSNTLKNIAVRYNIPVLSTVEYTKLPPGTKPSNSNVAETVSLEYDANVIAHLWNGCHEFGDKATSDMYHTVLGPQGPERRPIIEINIGKNKINSFKSKLYLKFFPASAGFRAHPLDIALAQQEQVAAQKKNNKTNKPIFSIENRE